MGEYNHIQFNSTYSKANFSKDDIIKNNKNYSQKFGLRLTGKNRSLPIMFDSLNFTKHQLELDSLLGQKIVVLNHCQV